MALMEKMRHEIPNLVVQSHQGANKQTNLNISGSSFTKPQYPYRSKRTLMWFCHPKQFHSPHAYLQAGWSLVFGRAHKKSDHYIRTIRPKLPPCISEYQLSLKKNPLSIYLHQNSFNLQCCTLEGNNYVISQWDCRLPVTGLIQLSFSPRTETIILS